LVFVTNEQQHERELFLCTSLSGYKLIYIIMYAKQRSACGLITLIFFFALPFLTI